MKTIRIRPPSLRIVLLIILSGMSLFASAEDDRMARIIYSLESGTVQQLQQKSEFLDLPRYDTREQLLDSLYSYYGFEQTERDIIEDDGDFSFLIEHAGYFYVSPQTGRIVLRYDVVLIFDSQTLSADLVMINEENATLYAIGNVEFIRDENEDQKNLSSEVMHLSFDDDTVILENGITSFTTMNSDDEQIEYFTSGEHLTLSTQPFIFSIDESVLTSSEQDRYYHIDASSLLLLEGNDLFLTDAVLYMGRVPIAYLPFFYYPGRTLVFNPSVGYDSERGSFFNTTYELYGSNPLIHSQQESGFSSLFSAQTSLIKSDDSWVYDTSEKEIPSELETWAQKSSSYASVYFDGYTELGLFAAIDTENHIYDDSLSFSLLGGLSYLPTSDDSGAPTVRYLMDADLNIALPGGDFSFAFPLYSDPDVEEDFLERKVSVDLNLTDSTSSSSYSSIDSYTWEMEGSYSFSIADSIPFIDSLELSNISSEIEFEEDDDSFIIDSIVLADLEASISGNLLSVTIPVSQREQQESSGYGDDQIALLDAYDLSPVEDDPENSRILTEIGASLDYKMTQQLYEDFDYDDGNQSDWYRQNKNISSLTFSSYFKPDLLTMTSSLKSSFSDSETSDESSKTYNLWSYTTVSSPYLSLSYTLNQKLYYYSLYSEDGEDDQEEEGFYSFTADYVSAHYVSYNPSFEGNSFTVTPSLTYYLPPVTSALNPSLTFSWKKFTSSISISFEESNDEVLEFSDGYVSLKYDGSAFSSSNTFDFEQSESDFPDFENMEFSSDNDLSLFEDYLELTFDITYDFDDMIIDDLSTSVSLPFLSASVNAGSDEGTFSFESFDVKVLTSVNEKRWWKNRISLSYDLAARYHHSIVDFTSSYLLFDLSLSFDIYEFLSVSFDLTSANHGLYRYASVGEAVGDFFDSFDFFGDGRSQTNFVMDSYSLSVTHYMTDWDFTMSFEGDLELEDGTYEWTPYVSIYVQWKAIPEFEVEREVEL